ncbi:MAG: glycoside hydrolase family 13 protein [Bacteroidales bacterium]|nr:glycoside hydrolase family 13 protein [Bacteroidales bacterium]
MTKYPSWAAEVVWYEIFPDRFCRGNFSNPIMADDLIGTTPWNFDGENWEISAWNAEWKGRQPHEQDNRKSLKMNVLRRRYCGDLQGVISKLEYLAGLGITALYFTPLQFSPSLHKYDGTNFLHIDPFLGTDALNDKQIIKNEDFLDFENAKWTSADLLALMMIEKAHSLGMKVIFDGVFNHIGYNSVPFQDVMKNREKSRFKDWFFIDFEKSTKKKLVYEKFWGCVKEMPKLNYSCKEVKQYVFSVLKRWLKPVVEGSEREGIDGWRIDHAVGVPMMFWKQANSFVKSIKKDALFLGELIEPDNVIKPYLDENCFDSVMNYGFYFAASEFFAPENNYISALQFDKKLRSQLKLFNQGSNFLAMNLLGTHDTERFASLVVNGNLKQFGSIEKFFENTHSFDKKYSTRQPNELERKIQKMAVVFEFSMVGSPMVFYGDELGMWGANDPDCRKPMAWENGDDEMLIFYKKIISFRNANKSVLAWGKFITYYADEKKRVYVYSRKKDEEEIFFAFNRETVPECVEIEISGCRKKLTLDKLSFTIFKSANRVEEFVF